ncbi:hypothetical protein VSQ48_23850 [Candidatus Ventrimonas sp. KK005]
MKKRLSLFFCTAAMTFLFGSAAYAWEALDTNNDGVADSVRFCDGYCIGIPDSDFYELIVYSPATEIGGEVKEGLNERWLNIMDENCRKNPGYVQRLKENRQKGKEKQARELEIGRQMVAKIDEIAGAYFNDSMTRIQKIYAVLEYCKGNYPFDDNVPDASMASLETKYEFLVKTKVLNKKQRNEMIRSVVFDNWAYDEVVGEYGTAHMPHSCSFGKYLYSVEDSPLRYGLDRLANNVATFFIDGKLYSLNMETLELTEGWTEEAKQSWLPQCEQRVWSISNNISNGYYGPEDVKWIPEEYKKFFRDNGYDAPWLQ